MTLEMQFLGTVSSSWVGVTFYLAAPQQTEQLQIPLLCIEGSKFIDFFKFKVCINMDDRKGYFAKEGFARNPEESS